MSFLHPKDNIDTDFDAGGKVSAGLTATTIVSQWTWAATLLQSATVASKVTTMLSCLDIVPYPIASNKTDLAPC